MRKYSIGAVLLDKNNPSKVLGRSVQPLLSAADEDREGYVPNVVYTCGALKHGKQLFLPYGVADSSVTFAFVEIADLLADLGYSPTALQERFAAFLRLTTCELSIHLSLSVSTSLLSAQESGRRTNPELTV